MTTDTVNLQSILEAVEGLREEVNSLRQRIEDIEASTSAVTEMSEEVQREELVATISAAVAAYLGFKPHIRQIRLLSSANWARHGRASIQASHQLSKKDQ